MEQIVQELIDNGPAGIIAIAVLTGLLVPKHTHEREVKRADEATKAASQNADALRDVSGATIKIAENVAQLRNELAILRAEVVTLRSRGAE